MTVDSGKTAIEEVMEVARDKCLKNYVGTQFEHLADAILDNYEYLLKKEIKNNVAKRARPKARPAGTNAKRTVTPSAKITFD